MRTWILALTLVTLSYTTAFAQALPTEAERNAADVVSYVTLSANVAMAVADCHYAGEWNKKCLIRLTIKNATSFGVSELLKRVIHEPRPCEPLCGRDSGTGSAPSGHTMISFVNVDPWGNTHLGLTVEYSFASATALGRVFAKKHNWWDVLDSAALAQGINAVVHQIK